MFQKSLSDLVRGIRGHKKDETQYISACMQEIKEELKNVDQQKKTVAIQKLTYLQMLGYDISWSAFNVIEVMSQTKFTGKRIGYLAAAQSFHEGTDVVMLATQLMRRDMTSSNVWEAGLAINCLANICTTDLARDLAADVVSLLNSSRPYIRKKACLVLYKIFLKFPDALRPSFPRLKEKLEDPDPSVVSASVNVICELARKNPKNYVALAPTLYNLLTNTTNNWMLIKLVKLFGVLLPVEQRLSKKLIQPLTNIINTTPAVSLIYECIETCTVGLSDHLPTMKLCISKLRTFVEDPDQNLKYLGLAALNNIMKIHPKAVAEHRDLVVNCLDDEDTTIRLRALDLLEGMVNKKNIGDIVRKLLDQIEKSEGAYKEGLVGKIIDICSKNTYQFVSDFEWYLSVLMELASVPNTPHGPLIGSQMMDVIIRVKVVRSFGVKCMTSLLRDPVLVNEKPTAGGMCEVLYAAAWVCGEFASELTDYLGTVEALLQPSAAALPAHIQAVYIQSALKIFGVAASGSTVGGGSTGPDDLLGELTNQNDAVQVQTRAVDNAQVQNIVTVMQTRLPLFTQSSHSEVQERACFVLQVLNLYAELLSSGTSLAADIALLFTDPLNPVAAKAQKKVPIPEDLDLDSWINEPPPNPVEEKEEETSKSFGFLAETEEGSSSNEVEPAELEARKEARRQHRAHDPYYLDPNKSTTVVVESHSEEDIPTVVLSEKELGLKPKDIIRRKLKPSKKSAHVEVMRTMDMPEGATASSGEEDEDEKENNALASIDLKGPLRPDEFLPTRQHRVVAPVSQQAKTKEKKPAKKRKEGTKATKEGAKTKGATATKEKKKKTGESSGGQLIDFGDEPSTVSSPPARQLPSDYDQLLSPPSELDRKKKTPTKKKEKTTTTGAKTKKEKASTTSSKKVAEEAPTTKTVPRFKPLCQDGNLSVIYELKVNPNEQRKIMVSFAFKNLALNPISGIQFTIPGTLSVRLASGSSTETNFTLGSGETNSHNIIFECSNIQQAQRLPGSIQYTIGSQTGKKDFLLNLPSSAFLLPVKLTKEQFVQVLQSTSFAASSTKIPLEKDFRSFVTQLSLGVKLEVVIFENNTASFYAKSIQGHQVAAYSKLGADNVVSLDLKCTDAVLASSLINEINALFNVKK